MAFTTLHPGLCHPHFETEHFFYPTVVMCPHFLLHCYTAVSLSQLIIKPNRFKTLVSVVTSNLVKKGQENDKPRYLFRMKRLVL